MILNTSPLKNNTNFWCFRLKHQIWINAELNPVGRGILVVKGLGTPRTCKTSHSTCKPRLGSPRIFSNAYGRQFFLNGKSYPHSPSWHQIFIKRPVAAFVFETPGFSIIIKKQTYIGNLSLWSSSYVFEVENFMFGIEEATEVNYDLILTNILIFPRLRWGY